jgi:hypothetical protein
MLGQTTGATLDGLDANDGDDLTVIIETPKGSGTSTPMSRFGAFVLTGILRAGTGSHSISASCPRCWVTTAICWPSWS